jgi:nitroreductase
MLEELVRKNRSYRRFDESFKVGLDTLKELVGLARLSASGANLQPLKYILSTAPEINEKIFSTLIWAAFLKDWTGPDKGQRPSAYIIVLLDKEVSGGAGVDHGIACQTMLLGAVERGLGGCMIGSVKREDLKQVMDLQDRYDILLVLALGKPAEEGVIEDIGPDGDTKYYRDENEVHHVPKRGLEDLIIGSYSAE